MVNEVGGVTDPSSVNIYSLDLEHSIGSGKSTDSTAGN